MLARTTRRPTRTCRSSIVLAFDTDEAGRAATEKAAALITDFHRSWGLPRSTDPRDIALAAAQRQFSIEAALDPESEDMEDVTDWLLMVWNMPHDDLIAKCVTADEYEAAVEARDTPMVAFTNRIDYKAIKDRVDIMEYIGRYSEIRRSGGGYKFMCPLHEDKHPSAHIYVNQKRWWCFVCNTGGDVIDYERARSQNERALPE